MMMTTMMMMVLVVLVVVDMPPPSPLVLRYISTTGNRWYVEYSFIGGSIKVDLSQQRERSRFNHTNQLHSLNLDMP